MSAHWEIRQGDVLDRLREMPDESVQCCITSPPYYCLRDYGVDGQIGLEETPEAFVARLVEVFAEVRRVLRPDGTLWLNLGDSYAGSWGAQSRGVSDNGTSTLTGSPLSGRQIAAHPKRSGKTGAIPKGATYKPKDLLGIPWMTAFALRADGWYLRRDIIWSKPNPMPESVTTRPTSAHEYVFLLSKSASYHYDAEAIREKRSTSRDPVPDGWAMEGVHSAVDYSRRGRDKQRGHGRRHAGFNDRWDALTKLEQQAAGRNKRSVWEIASQPYPEAHFATFPEALVLPMVLAGSSPQACGTCGAPWARVVERLDQGYDGSRYGERIVSASGGAITGGTARSTLGSSKGALTGRSQTVCWRSTCDHDDDSGRSIVLDPFAGSGTTLKVAVERGRDAIGIELNPEYVGLAERRLAGVTAPLFSTEEAA